jgi:ppGpp synthetase/RelA/SpoT-type nucleotidyltranferase
MELSKSQVNRAGQALARARSGIIELSPAERLSATEVVDAWRQQHAAPLAWVTDRVAARVGPISTQVVVAQRLKRMPQIIKKLARYQNMNLARMQDLGGCRVVLAGLDELTDAMRLIDVYQASNRWVVKHVADYRERGREDTGYRAVHMIVERDHRLIEIQLRTLRQHSWAEAVERVTARSDHDVKEGRGPEDYLEYFRLSSDAFYELDCRRPVSRTVRDRFRELHRELGRVVVGAA